MCCSIFEKRFFMKQFSIPLHTRKKILMGETKSLGLEKLGIPVRVTEYNVEEIYNGVIYEHGFLRSDSGEWINLNHATATGCELVAVTLIRGNNPKQYATKELTFINNINKFYVRNYFVEIKGPKDSTTRRYGIMNYLKHVEYMRKGTGKYKGLFGIKNDYAMVQSFKSGRVPKDVFAPVKFEVNGRFFEDEYKIRDFILLSKIKF